MNQEEIKARRDQYIERLTTIRSRIKKRWNKEASAEEQIELRSILDDIDAIEKEPIARNISKFDPSSDMSVGVDRAGLKPFDSFGEQLQAIRNAGVPGAPVDNRLFDIRAASGLNEGVPSEGGFLVQSDYASEIMRNVWESPIPSRIRKFRVSGNANGLKINGIDETSRADGSRSGGIQSYWRAEATEYTATKPAFRQIGLSLNKLTGLCYTTDELLEDAAALENAVGMAFADEFAFKISDGIVNGSGAGQPLGIMNAGSLITVAKETSQVDTTIVFENIAKMWSRLLPASHKNSVWLCNPDCLPQLMQMSVKILNVAGTENVGGTPVYQPANGAAGQPFSTLMGRPVVMVEQCQTLGTTGDIILADLSNYVGIDKGSMKTDYSMHLRFIYGEGIFRATYRFDGQPVLASAITPATGTSTLGHFICVATRSS